MLSEEEKIKYFADNLKREAANSTRFRNHVLGPWSEPNSYWFPDKIVSSAKCIRCGMEVSINTKPQPNDIDISGEAVALTCEGSK
jgi:hypothetical protein